jgi:hypothetical protein
MQCYHAVPLKVMLQQPAACIDARKAGWLQTNLDTCTTARRIACPNEAWATEGWPHYITTAAYYC